MHEARISVPQNLSALSAADEMIFVDYADPIGAPPWDDSGSQRSPKMIRLKSLPWFHINHARNIAGKRSQREILIFLDVDHIITQRGIEECRALHPAHYLIQYSSVRNPGFLAVHRDDYFKVQGYEEALCGYGHDDYQMRKTLSAIGRTGVGANHPIKYIGDGNQIRILETQKRALNNAVNIALARSLRRLHPYKNNVGRNWGWDGNL